MSESRKRLRIIKIDGKRQVYSFTQEEFNQFVIDNPSAEVIR